MQYSLVRPDGSLRRDLARSTAIGPIYWSIGDRYIAFDGRFEARTLALGTADGPAGCAGRSIRPIGTQGTAAVARRRCVEQEQQPPCDYISEWEGAAATRLWPRRCSTAGLVARWRDDSLEASRGAVSGFGLYVVHVRDAQVVRLAAAARHGGFSPSGRACRVFARDRWALHRRARWFRAPSASRRRSNASLVAGRQWITFQSGRQDRSRYVPTGPDRGLARMVRSQRSQVSRPACASVLECPLSDAEPPLDTGREQSRGFRREETAVRHHAILLSLRSLVGEADLLEGVRVALSRNSERIVSPCRSCG